MLDRKGAEGYWKDKAEKNENPCHYANSWQNRYAYHIRTGVIRASDFAGADEVVDLGCGIGEYTRYIATLTKAHIVGFDFAFNIVKAKASPASSRIEFRVGALPEKEVADAISSADVAYTTTVYVHLPKEARAVFLEAAGRMRRGARVLLLEYAPEVIPEFQKGHTYKEVETPAQIIDSFTQRGFKLKELRHVNFIDSAIYFKLGINAITYAATLFLDSLLRLTGATNSKYKLFIFEKQ